MSCDINLLVDAIIKENKVKYLVSRLQDTINSTEFKKLALTNNITTTNTNDNTTNNTNNNKLKWLNDNKNIIVTNDGKNVTSITVNSIQELREISEEYNKLMNERGLVDTKYDIFEDETKWMKEIFTDLDNVMFSNGPIKIQFKEKIGKDGEQGRATGKNNIWLTTNSGDINGKYSISPIKIALHEFGHTITIDAIKNNEALAKRIRSIMKNKEVAALEKDPEMAYAFTNESEFIAEVLSNAKLQKALSKINTTSANGNTMLDTVINIFKKLLKQVGNDTAKNALGDSLSIVVEINNNNNINEKEKQKDTSTAGSADNKNKYTNHSGGATGADSIWGKIGEAFGITNNHYYWGNKTPNGNFEISKEDFEEGRIKAAEAAKLNYGAKFTRVNSPLLARNWAQVKYADAVYAIAPIAKKGEKLFPNQKNDTRIALFDGAVKGGTGYAVGMAIIAKKPVYVFDDGGTNKWYTYNYDTKQMEETSTPILTNNFAGIGSRKITDAGKNAINDVYENTFNNKDKKDKENKEENKEDKNEAPAQSKRTETNNNNPKDGITTTVRDTELSDEQKKGTQTKKGKPSELIIKKIVKVENGNAYVDFGWKNKKTGESYSPIKISTRTGLGRSSSGVEYNFPGLIGYNTTEKVDSVKQEGNGWVKYELGYKFDTNDGFSITYNTREKVFNIEPAGYEGMPQTAGSVLSINAKTYDELINKFVSIDDKKLDEAVSELKGRKDQGKKVNRSGLEKYEIFPNVYANEGQKEAIDNISKWFKNVKGYSTYMLKGRGGTGKTAVISKVLENLGLSAEEVIFSVFTHKATSVLKMSNKGSKYENSSYHTTAALRNLKPGENYEMVADLNAMDKITDMHKILVIDEASMIGTKLKKEIELLAARKGVKIIYMGDNVQLAPIEKDSKGNNIKESPLFSEHEDNGNISVLNQVMRQGEDSPILDITNQIASAVETNSDIGEFNKDEKLYNDGVGVLYNDSYTENIENFIKDLEKNPTGTKWIGFNNASHHSTIEKNRIIRKALFKEKKSEENKFIVGEQLVAAETQTIGMTAMYHNGDEFTLINKTENYDKNNKTNSVEALLWVNGEKLPIKIVPNNLPGTTLLTIQNNLTAAYATKEGLAAPITTAIVLSEEGINKIIAEGEKIARKAYEKQERTEDEINRLVDKSLKGLEESIKKNYANIEYGYVINVHKAQGSTYDTVYADVGNIMTAKMQTADAKKKGLYVATSRPRTKLVMMNTDKMDKTTAIHDTATNNEDIISDDDKNNIVSGDEDGIIFEDQYADIADYVSNIDSNELGIIIDAEPAGYIAPNNEFNSEISFQHKSDEELLNNNKELGDKILKHLQKMFPNITTKSINNILDKEGINVLGMAMRDIVMYDPDIARIDTIPHEYAHIYIDMLENTTYIKNTIGMIIREQNVTKDEAKEILATKMGQYVVEIARGNPIGSKYGKLTNKYRSLMKKVWDNIIKIFKILFDSKNFLKVKNEMRAQVLANKMYEGVNSDAISFTNKKGTELIDPTYDFEHQEFSSGIVYDVMNASNGSAIFTGSEALAMQGKVYRKQGDNGTDLHDLDFAVPDVNTSMDIVKKLDDNYSVYLYSNFYVPANEELAKKLEELVVKVPQLMTLVPLAEKLVKYIEKNNIKTLAILPKGFKVSNVHKFNEEEDKGRIVSYNIIDENNKVVGTYKAEVKLKDQGFGTDIVSETKTGVKAVLVDLIEDKTDSKTSIWKAPNGQDITISHYTDIFAAKNKLSPFTPRDKDAMDFNNFFKNFDEIPNKDLVDEVNKLDNAEINMQEVAKIRDKDNQENKCK